MAPANRVSITGGYNFLSFSGGSISGPYLSLGMGF